TCITHTHTQTHRKSLVTGQVNTMNKFPVCQILSLYLSLPPSLSLSPSLSLPPTLFYLSLLSILSLSLLSNMSVAYLIPSIVADVAARTVFWGAHLTSKCCCT